MPADFLKYHPLTPFSELERPHTEEGRPQKGLRKSLGWWLKGQRGGLRRRFGGPKRRLGIWGMPFRGDGKKGENPHLWWFRTNGGDKCIKGRDQQEVRDEAGVRENEKRKEEVDQEWEEEE